MSTNSSMNLVENIFQKGLELHHYTNTAYPLDHNLVWKDYKVKKENVSSVLADEWRDVNELGLYVHIPFCKKRCSYCEYAVLQGDDATRESDYVDLLTREISMYKNMFKDINGGKISKTVIGLDVGGGTPTTLSPNSISRIVDTTLNGFNLADDFSISIETTPILANNLVTMKDLRKAGIDRISMGVQTIDKTLLEHVGRYDCDINILKTARDNIRAAGFQKYNIDVMYGFLNQSVDSFLDTLNFVMDLEPEYITLYRNRYKGTKLEHEAENIKLDDVNNLYSVAFDAMNSRGYAAGLGKNTFSKIKDDPGTSAYLTKRVIDGTPYLGLGLGSQSMSRSAIYYNQGAASKALKGYESLLKTGNYPVQDLYSLPLDEMISKMTSVSFYFGYINTNSFEKRFGVDFNNYFSDEIRFLQDKNLMEYRQENAGVHEGNILFQLTKSGKDSINGIIPLFYSKISKDNLLQKNLPKIISGD